MKYPDMQALQEKMSEPRKQHFVAAFTSALDVIKRNIITLIVILWVGSRGNDSYTHIIIITITFISLLVWGIIYWQRFTYLVDNGTLIIKYGVIVQKNLSLSRDRIQVIDITAGPVQRAFGLVSVQVKTAGATSDDAFISAITLEEAENLKAALKKERATNEKEFSTESETKIPEKNIQLPHQDLIKAAATSGSIGIIFPILGGVLSQIDLIIPQHQIFSFFDQWIPESSNIWISLGLMAIVLAWILAFIVTYVNFYNFSLSYTNDQIIVKRGLFEKRQLTIPFNRIQAFSIHETLIREPFKLATLYVESAGYGEEGKKSTILFPLISRHKVQEFITRLLPEYDVHPPLKTPPERSKLRYLRRSIIPALIIIIAAVIFLPYGYLSSILLIPAGLLGLARFKAAGMGISNDTLVLNFRTFGMTTAIIKNHRIQDISMAQNIFQKRIDVSHLITNVASGREGKRFIIHDMTTEDGQEVWSWASPSLSEHERQT